MLFRVPDLPDEPLAAAARFHAEVLPLIREQLASESRSLVLVFAPASYEHRAWRLAVVQALARNHAPIRVNALESSEAAATEAAARYLADALGVTGQLLPLDGNGAGEVLYCAT